MKPFDYEHGFKVGYDKGRKAHHRIAWFKLFGFIVLGTFCAHFIWALIATLV